MLKESYCFFFCHKVCIKLQNHSLLVVAIRPVYTFTKHSFSFHPYLALFWRDAFPKSAVNIPLSFAKGWKTKAISQLLFVHVEGVEQDNGHARIF